MTLGEPDIKGPRTQDLNWLTLLAQLVFPHAKVKVFAGDAVRTGAVRVRVSFTDPRNGNSAFSDLKVPNGALANRDWKHIVGLWQVDNATALVVKNSNLVH